MSDVLLRQSNRSDVTDETSDFVIRRARESEYESVADLLVRAFSSSFDVSPEYEADLRNVDGHAREYDIWVAVRDDAPIGVVFVPKDVVASEGLKHVRPWEREFRMLAVSPDERGQGIATALIDRAVGELGAQGIRTVSICTGMRMRAARRVYERYGFIRRRDREDMLVDGGYRVVQYTYGIPASRIRPNPRLDELEAVRPFVPYGDVPGSIPGFLHALSRVLPAEALRTDDDSLAAYGSDRSGFSDDESPFVVVLPSTIEQVQQVMRLASRYRIPVFPRGRGTGLAGGSVPTRSGIVLSLERLDGIGPVDVVNRSVRVQAGVVTADISRHTEPAGLFYAPDPASAGISSIGGNIATNAGGFHCVKYGVTRDSILSLTAVLADGTLVTTGTSSVKDVAGLDLTSLLVGSEGELAIVVEAVLRLHPVPCGRHVVVGLFDSLSRVGDAVRTLMSSSLEPAMCELMATPQGLEASDCFRGHALESRWMLLVGLEGEQTEDEVREAYGLLQGTADDVVLPREEDLGLLLALRRKGKPFPPGSWMAGGDVCVPVSALPRMLSALESIASRHGLGYSIVAHVGDGNLHTAFFTHRLQGQAKPPNDLAEARSEWLETAVRSDGSLTGEHGVGIDLADLLGRQVGDRLIAIQKGIKNVFDPLGILNPGKWL